MKVADAVAHQIPRLKPEMVAELPEDPKRLVAFVKRGAYSSYRGPEYSYVFRYGDGRFPDLKADRWYVSLFVPDLILEDRVWRRLRQFVRDLKAWGVYAVLGVSFTIWGDDPLPVQIYNHWRTRYVERYLQDHGIYVVPYVEATLPLLELVARTTGRQRSLCVNYQLWRKSRSNEDLNVIRGRYIFKYLVERGVYADSILVNGGESVRSKILAFAERMGRKYYFVEWGREYREYLARKRQDVLRSLHRGGVPISQ